jgi:hypothetical protein
MDSAAPLYAGRLFIFGDSSKRLVTKALLYGYMVELLRFATKENNYKYLESNQQYNHLTI